MPSNNPRPTKIERREAARKEAERLAAKQKATERRNRLILVAASAVVVALIVVAGVIIAGQAGRTQLTDFEGERPAYSDDRGGIAVGTAAEDGIDEDLPTLEIYVDFMCPFCGEFEGINGDDVATLATDGSTNVVYHPLSNLDSQSMGTAYSTRSANAFATVATEAPDAAVPFMQAMFVDQPAEGSEGRTDEEIAQIAVDAGVPQEVADTLSAGTYNDWVVAATEQSREDGNNATPSILIDGERFEGNWQEPGTLLAAVEAAG